MTTPQPITTRVQRMSKDTLRECSLVAKRARSPETWTRDDYVELMQLQRNAQLAAEQRAADLVNDEATEARSFPAKPSIHD